MVGLGELEGLLARADLGGDAVLSSSSKTSQRRFVKTSGRM